MNDRRVVITGLGVVTPVGNDIDTFWRNLKNGVSGIGRIRPSIPPSYDCRIGGEVRNFDPKPFFKNPKDVRRTDRFAQLAMAAAKMAMDDSGDRYGEDQPARSLRRDREQRNRRPENPRGSAHRSDDQRADPDFAFHHSDADQQHGQRHDLDGIRIARPEPVHRHGLRHLEQRHRRIVAHN